MGLHLTMAFGDNPRVAPLKDGTVKPEGIDLEIVTVHGGMLFYRNLAYDEFDVSEMSISETLLARERRETLGNGRWDWSALPVFLSRGHMWSGLYVNTSSGINSLADLKGKRIAVPDYDMTAALWMRCTLKDLYGIEAGDNVWFNARTKELSHGGALGLHMPEYEVQGVDHSFYTVDQAQDSELENGTIDACTVLQTSGTVTAGDTTIIDRYGGTQMTNNPKVKRLLPDGGWELIREYYQKTQFHHVNHNIIVQNRILKDHPWVAMELYQAFERSKQVAYERARDNLSGYLYMGGREFAEQAEVFGEDPYPIGLNKMGKNIERAIQGSYEQGLLRRPLALDEVYFHTTLNT